MRALASVLFILLLGAVRPAAAQDGKWIHAETEHFVVYGDVGEAQLRESVTTLERFDATLRRLLHVADDGGHNKLDIFLLRSHGDLADFSPHVPSQVGGFYSTSIMQIAAHVIDYHDADLPGRQILFHEYAHHFMFEYFTAAYPSWFVEGFAEFVQTMEFHGDVAQIGHFNLNRAEWLGSGSWVPIEDFLTWGANHHSVDSAHLYAQAWLATHYIFDDDARRRALGAYINAINSGQDQVAAFQPAFGVSPSDFQSALRRYYHSGIPVYSLPSPTPQVDIHIEHMSPAADDLLAMQAVMRSQHPSYNTPAFLDRVARVAANYPNDPLAQRTLAFAQILQHQFDAARATLAPLTGEGSTDQDALFLAGYSYVQEAEANSAESETAPVMARRYFVRVFHINPNHVPTLYYYAETYARAGQRLAPQQLDVLVAAHLQAPQVQEIANSTGAELMRAERWDEAISALSMVAYYPHNGHERDYARLLVQAAQQHQLPPPEPARTTDDDD